jgi:DNA repair protein RadC
MLPSDRSATKLRSAKGAPRTADTPYLADADAPDQGSFLEQSLPLHIGHRERLRHRFETGGADTMPDYELIEHLLFRSIPRRDTKDLAKRLLVRFGSFAEVIHAPPERIKEVKGAGDAVASDLKLMREVALSLKRDEMVRRPSVFSTAQVVEYVRAAQA